MFSALPHITPFEFEGPANAGDTVQVACHVPKGDRPLQVHWLFDGSPPAPNMGISTMMVGHRANFLSISHVRALHSGNYTCVARNPAGIISHSAELVVNGITCHIFFCSIS